MAEFYIVVAQVEPLISCKCVATHYTAAGCSENMTENKELKPPEISAGHACVELIGWPASNNVSRQQ